MTSGFKSVNYNSITNVSTTVIWILCRHLDKNLNKKDENKVQAHFVFILSSPIIKELTGREYAFLFKNTGMNECCLGSMADRPSRFGGAI